MSTGAHERARVVLDPTQRRAVELVCSAPVGIVTGGPGTGKSTCLEQAVDQLERSHRTYALASPTGKAAKRLAEATKRDACTLHRLLEYSPRLGGFGRNADEPLDQDVVIVDESSMLDIELMAALCAAIDTRRTRLILVGDADQLPPVGAGQPFADMVRAGIVPVVRLGTLHRSAADSWIHTAAQCMLRGHGFSLDAMHDFRFAECTDPAWILPKVRRLCLEAFPRGGPRGEAQVLIPQRPGVAGVDAANVQLQAALNPPPPTAAGHRDPTPGDLRAGDRVIQTKNNYDLGVYNGEVGRVLSVDAATGAAVVEYPDHGALAYTGAQAAALQLAYALTVHKTQGSEYPWTIVVCHSTHTYMLSRQLLYTAITRAKAGVVLVGDRKGIDRAVRNRQPAVRHTSLLDRIRDGDVV